MNSEQLKIKNEKKGLDMKSRLPISRGEDAQPGEGNVDSKSNPWKKEKKMSWKEMNAERKERLRQSKLAWYQRNKDKLKAKKQAVQPPAVLPCGNCGGTGETRDPMGCGLESVHPCLVCSGRGVVGKKAKAKPAAPGELRIKNEELKQQGPPSSEGRREGMSRDYRGERISAEVIALTAELVGRLYPFAKDFTDNIIVHAKQIREALK